MNSALIRRLRREAAANPAKAGALALVLVIAMWFWVPLVIRWCSSPADSADAAAAVVTQVSQAPASAAVVVAKPDEQYGETIAPVGESASSPAPSWQSLMQAIEQDRRMQPNRQLSQSRDPFGPSDRELAAAKIRQQKKTIQPLAPELAPADAGLVLNSTLVGSGRRMALICGEPYWVGDSVPAPRGHERFTLVEVLPRQVVLQWQGKQYGLEIKVTPRRASEGTSLDETASSRSNTAANQTRARNPLPRSGKAATVSSQNLTNPFAKSNAE